MKTISQRPMATPSHCCLSLQLLHKKLSNISRGFCVDVAVNLWDLIIGQVGSATSPVESPTGPVEAHFWIIEINCFFLICAKGFDNTSEISVLLE